MRHKKNAWFHKSGEKIYLAEDKTGMNSQISKSERTKDRKPWRSQALSHHNRRLPSPTAISLIICVKHVQRWSAGRRSPDPTEQKDTH